MAPESQVRSGLPARTLGPPSERQRLSRLPRPIRQFPFHEPVVIELAGTVIAANVGGAVIPGLLSRGGVLFLTKVIVPLLLLAASS